MLVGRESDVDVICAQVIRRSLIVVDGYSGVGKTSLLQNGVYGALREAGYTTLVARNWGAREDAASVDAYVVESILASHGRNQEPAMPGAAGDRVSTASVDKLLPPLDGDLRRLLEGHVGSGLIELLEDRFHSEGAAVVVLDQFEELLRQPTSIAADIVAWVKDATFSQDTVRFVVSLRTDYLHLLDPLLKGVRPFSLHRHHLKDVSGEEDIAKVARTVKQSSADGSDVEASADHTIDADVVEVLLGAWRKTQPTPKLLDLQATLYALYFLAKSRAHGGEGVQISMEDVDGLLSCSSGGDVQGRAEGLFAAGLEHAMALKIDQAHRAAREVGLDPYLAVGTREAVRRMAPMLSSGDVKVPVSGVDLTRGALATELELLGHDLLQDRGSIGDGDQRATLASAHAMVEEVLGELQAHPGLLEPGRDLPRFKKLFPRAQSDASAKSSRMSKLAAGPLLGASASTVLFEEVRRAAFAIRWLEETQIARRNPDGTISLVHDRAGRALVAWAEASANDPEVAVRQLTVRRGSRFVWTDGWFLESDVSTQDATQARVLPNINWRYCRVTAHFRNLVFVNCDFTGMLFDGCTFQGVTFVNCLLSDANFDRCTIVGKVTHADVTRAKAETPGGDEDTPIRRVAPSFVLDATVEEVEALRWYRGGGAGDARPVLFSDTSGVAATAGGVPSDHNGEVLAHLGSSTSDIGGEGLSRRVPTTGGIVMLSGRLYFLTFYRCRSEPGENGAHGEGGISFHHVSGEGLGIVEPPGGPIDVYDGAIRGVSVSRDGSEQLKDVSLTVRESIVANAYFAQELRGVASFEDCRLMMVLNAASTGQLGLKVRVSNCHHQFLVNTDAPDIDSIDEYALPASSPKRTFLAAEGSRSTMRDEGAREGMAVVQEAMDFRERPEEWEQEQRRERAGATLTG